MINMAVISLKDIAKYLIKFIIFISIIIGTFTYASKLKNNAGQIEILQKNTFLSCLNVTIPGAESINNEKKEKAFTNIESPLKIALGIELEMMSSLSNEEEENKNIADSNNTKEETKNEQEEPLEQAKTGLQTEVQSSNVPNKYTVQYNGVKIKNETKYKLTKEILTPNINIKTENILIFHTHASESYTSSEKYKYKPTGNFRTTDKNYSVIRVGRELDKQLKSYGYKVTHNETLHDYPSYSGSYDNSLKTVSNILEKNKDTDIVIDIHRDAIADSKYAPTVKIGDDYAAQLMFVIGSDGGSTKHENWQENLKFAVKIQEKANELYPGLFKPIILRNSSYNQELAKAAVIIEVGATGNTLDQSITSMKYLAKVIDEAIK